MPKIRADLYEIPQARHLGVLHNSVYEGGIRHLVAYGLGLPSGCPGRDACASALMALIANHPPIYREVISSTLKHMRPGGVEVFTAKPEDLEGE